MSKQTISVPTFGNSYVPHGWEKPECAAAFVVLEATMKRESFKCFGPYGFDLERLLRRAEVWSSTEQILAKVAMELYQPGSVSRLGHTPATAWEIFILLDERQRSAVDRAVGFVREGRRAVLDYLKQRSP